MIGAKRTEVIGDCTMYLGDCLEILPKLGPVDAVVTDPPYGIGYKASQPNAIQYARIANDDRAFNPQPFVEHDCILWGANNFASNLPRGGWLVWDKRCSEAADRMMGSPFELAWSNNSKLYKMCRLQHGGAKNADALNGDVANAARFHPTQKPVELMKWCIDLLPSTAQTILDPFCGSGSTGVACVKLGREFVGIEIDEGYFDIACERIRKAYAQPDMFIAKPAPAKQEALL